MNARRWHLILLLSLALPVASPWVQAGSDQDSTGLPGDHFSLQGALELFKKCASPEEFEKLLNTADNHVNNLDLNGDGEVDYVRVVGKNEGDARMFVLQVPVSEKENQDIAVIGIEKTGDTTAIVQIIGDEDIFGDETIVEPGDGDEDEAEVEEENDAKGPFAPVMATAPMMPRIVVNVWFWPSVRFVYAPAYVAWVSPWRWRVWPGWWRPWHPLAWRVFHPFRARVFPGIALVHTRRVVAVHRMYRPLRVSSVTVHTRHGGAVKSYRVRRTTVIKGPAGRTRVRTTRVRPRR